MARSLAGCGADRSPASGRRCSQPPPSACWAARQRLIRGGGPLLQSEVRGSVDPAGPQTAGPAQNRQRRARLLVLSELSSPPGTEEAAVTDAAPRVRIRA